LSLYTLMQNVEHMKIRAVCDPYLFTLFHFSCLMLHCCCCRWTMKFNVLQLYRLPFEHFMTFLHTLGLHVADVSQTCNKILSVCRHACKLTWLCLISWQLIFQHTSVTCMSVVYSARYISVLCSHVCNVCCLIYSGIQVFSSDAFCAVFGWPSLTFLGRPVVHNRGKDEINVNECREWRSVSCQLIFRHPFENAVICAVLQNLSL